MEGDLQVIMDVFLSSARSLDLSAFCLPVQQPHTFARNLSYHLL